MTSDELAYVERLMAHGNDGHTCDDTRGDCLSAMSAFWSWRGDLLAAARREARLREVIEAVLTDAESQHPGGWGPDVTTVAFLRAALADEADR